MKTKPIEIDFVLPWVDGNDPLWISLFQQFTTSEGDKDKIRFRDWDLLRYWFRGVSEYAPWVRKIHFITSGELPEWLNIDHPKLHWVKHSDFIPAQYLPTFNINTIETNIHLIDGLSEHFVYFNDDIFILKDVKETDFFRKGRPCDCAILDPIFPKEYPEVFVNSILALNRNFNKQQVIKKNLGKWINLQYGKYLIRNILLSPWKRFPGILSAHLSQAFVKDTFYKVWDLEEELLQRTCSSKFRSLNNCNQWLFRYWQLAEGNFSPSNTMRKGMSFEITTESINLICKFIRTQQKKQICINDGNDIDDFLTIHNKLSDAFSVILPNRSAFEK